MRAFSLSIPVRCAVSSPLLAGYVLWLALGAPSVSAETMGCTKITFKSPSRVVLRCADGLAITAEEATDFTLTDNDADGLPDAAEVRNHGLLLNFTPSRRRPEFQILTPHAIAAVRGTTWAVDVSDAGSSVFVKTGVVKVRRRGAQDGVQLRGGEGVDVSPGTNILEAKRWDKARAAGLLARFGR
jgi:hypothetical protein